MQVHWLGGTYETAMEHVARYWAERREACKWQAKLNTAFDSPEKGKKIHVQGPLAQIVDRRLAQVGMR